MKTHKISRNLLLTGLATLISLTGGINPVLSQANSEQKITIACGKTLVNGKEVPTTAVYIPMQRKKRIITWVSGDLDKTLTIEQRCQIVSRNFQKAYEEGRLQYVTFGRMNGYPVICAAENRGETCNRQNHLFTLKQGSDPKKVMKKLMDILENKTSDTLFQSSGDNVYVSFEEWLKVAPEIEENN